MTISSYCLIGLVFIVIGILMRLYPPKDINRTLGYKTPFAMKNKDTWNEGNRFFCILIIGGGILFIILIFIFEYIYVSNFKDRLLGIIMFVIIIGSMIFTEIHLRRVFHRDGNRKGKIHDKH